MSHDFFFVFFLKVVELVSGGSVIKTARVGFTSGRRVSVTGAAAAAFIDVTLVEKDGQPPAAHSVILTAVRAYSGIF